MMKNLAFLFLSIFFSMYCVAQDMELKKGQSNIKVNNSRPKLVIGIVVDQMRYDYLTRFYNKYDEGGFKRMVREGFNCNNNHFNYVPTYTGPGHASVYTGTTPKYHGVIANDWYDKVIKRSVYCANDNSVNPVGTTSSVGKMSPHRMKTTTFADQNRLFTQMKGKTIGISIKDRGAIFPAGHTANGAYWFRQGNEGHWISSTFYMNKLPKWVNDFNNSEITESYFKEWNTLKDIKTYTESGSDLSDFEGGFKGKKGVFPYDLAALKSTNGNFDIIKETAYGNSLITDFALAAIAGEQLGEDNITDVLTISYSSTDYVGHNFGVNSKEVEDTYIRLDKDLERLFNALDKSVGDGEYTVFLTADHGAIDVPRYLKSVKIPSGYIDYKLFKDRFNAFMINTFNASDLVENISNDQIFLNRKKIKELGLNLQDVQQTIVNEIIDYAYIDKVYSATTMTTASFTNGIELLLQNGFSQKRSGDIIMVLDPAIIAYKLTGSTHGSGLNYDTHVPLLFFGKGIAKGSTLQRTNITDIAPTMSALLGISFPDFTTGNPLEFVLD